MAATLAGCKPATEPIEFISYSLQKRKIMVSDIINRCSGNLPVIIHVNNTFLYLLYPIDTTFHWMNSDISKRFGFDVSISVKDSSPQSTTTLRALYAKNTSEDGCLYMEAKKKK